jgi:hypothetical protein
MKHGDLVDLLELNIAGRVLAVVLHMAGDSVESLQDEVSSRGDVAGESTA